MRENLKLSIDSVSLMLYTITTWYSDTPRKGILIVKSYSKRVMITLIPELESELSNLKKEKFHDSTQAEMYRYLINLGLESLNKGNQKNMREKNE